MERPTDDRGAPEAIVATLDHGSDSAAAVQALEDGGFDPSIAPGRQKPHAPEAEAIDALTTVKERRTANVRTPEGQALYARRKVIVEPVFGQIKACEGSAASCFAA